MKQSLDYLKFAFRPIIKLLITPSIIWIPVKLTVRQFPYIYVQLKELREWSKTRKKELSTRCSNILFSDRTVLNGPFASMSYPEMTSIGSALYPKLLGSYERELHEVMDYIVEQNYECIVVIGCAEGYYAVGLAIQMKNVRVYAFDIDQDAIRLCEAMAALNNVQIRTSGHFSPGTFSEICLGKRALIISDCEGYESEIFTHDTRSFLRDHDLLIETHKTRLTNTLTQMRDVVSCTHTISEYCSIHDTRRAYQYVYPELNGFDIIERTKILAEGRNGKSTWIFARPRS